MNKNTYNLSYATFKNASNNNFILHNHDYYEMYMFIEGDSRYIVEDKSYPLAPYDIIIIRRHEMHRVFHNSLTKYSRFVLNINPDFFREMNCEEYETQFLPSNTAGNKIDSNDVHSSGIYDAYLRLKKYSDNFTKSGTPVITAEVIEILYLINQITSFSKGDTKNKPIQLIISYINKNYSEDITLEDLSKQFYISKYHLCRIFKQATGYTPHSYITHKRITRVRELIQEGKNLTDSVNIAGFENYSSFYRSYLKEYGNTPKSLFTSSKT